MALIDRQYLARPYYGSRRMAAWLATQGHPVNRKRVQRLMRVMGLVAVYQRPNTSKPTAAHKIYPYLLSGLSIERVNQVWCADITYIPMAKGFLYLVAVMDWYSRTVLAAVEYAWRRFLRRGRGGGAGPVRQARNLQHRPGLPIHGHRLHGCARTMRDHDQQGWQRPLHGQYLHRAVMAQPEV
jgi:transposase InsO family protein